MAALGLFCRLHLSDKQPKRQASSTVVEQVISIWNRARIPTCRKDLALNNEQKPTDGQSTEKRPKRVTLAASKASDVSLLTFVSQHTRQLFNKLCISEDFMTVDPELWASREC